MNEDFGYLLSKFGKPADPVFLTDEEIASCRGRLPESLLEFWRQVGLGAWGNGLFQFCRPAEYASIMKTVFKGDPEIDSGNCMVFGYEAFSQLHVWHHTLGGMKVDLLFADVEADFSADAKQLEIDEKLGPDQVIAVSLYNVVKAADIKDEDGEAMFERAVQALGATQRMLRLCAGTRVGRCSPLRIPAADPRTRALRHPRRAEPLPAGYAQGP